MKISTLKNIALVHDWYSSQFFGGAESTVNCIYKILFEMFDQEPILYALFEDITVQKDNWLFGKKIKTSFIQNLPFSKKYLQNYLLLFPLAIEQLNLSEYDLILSSSHVAAKGILTSPNQLHISYVHTPMRYAWDQMNVYLAKTKFKQIGLEPFIRIVLHYLRSWDQTSSIRVDKLIANSNFTAKRIKKYWGRDSKVIFPPVDTERFNYQKQRGDFYVSVCRLVANKRVDIIVKAFNYLKLPLLIIGEGPEKNKLKKIAGKNIKLIGFQKEEKLKMYLESTRAFVYAGIEDFGIAPVEAMAAGAPVIAYDNAGLKDTVNCISSNSKIPTGILFKEQSVQCLIDAIQWFEEKKLWESIQSQDLRNWANKFSLNNFTNNFTNHIDECCNDFF